MTPTRCPNSTPTAPVPCPATPSPVCPDPAAHQRHCPGTKDGCTPGPLCPQRRPRPAALYRGCFDHVVPARPTRSVTLYQLARHPRLWRPPVGLVAGGHWRRHCRLSWPIGGGDAAGQAAVQMAQVRFPHCVCASCSLTSPFSLPGSRATSSSPFLSSPPPSAPPKRRGARKRRVDRSAPQWPSACLASPLPWASVSSPASCPFSRASHLPTSSTASLLAHGMGNDGGQAVSGRWPLERGEQT